MCRHTVGLLIVICLIASGCCHCYTRSYYPGRGPIATAVAAPIRAVTGCSKGCGDVYFGEWVSDPPDDCDPCCNGQYVGPRECCGGRPHTRLCIWQILERVQGIRGSCVSGGCCDSCGPGGCGGCSSCGEGGPTGGEWEVQHPVVSESYYQESVPSRSAPTIVPYTGPTSTQSGSFHDPAWNRVNPRPAPGVPTPTGRLPAKGRSASDSRYKSHLRSVSYDEELDPSAEPALETSAADQRELEEVLPDPRARYRR